MKVCLCPNYTMLGRGVYWWQRKRSDPKSDTGGPGTRGLGTAETFPPLWRLLKRVRKQAQNQVPASDLKAGGGSHGGMAHVTWLETHPERRWPASGAREGGACSQDSVNFLHSAESALASCTFPSCLARLSGPATLILLLCSSHVLFYWPAPPAGKSLCTFPVNSADFLERVPGRGSGAEDSKDGGITARSNAGHPVESEVQRNSK